MKKQSSTPLRIAKLFSILLIMLTFLCLFVFCAFLPRTKKSNFDNLIERPKLSFNGLLNGSYTEQYADWFGDTVCRRDKIKETYAVLESWFGMDFNKVDKWTWDDPDDPDDSDDPYESNIGSDSSVPPDVSGGEESSQATSSGGETSGSDVSQPPKKPPELIGDLLFYDDRVLEVYHSDKNLKYIPRYTDALNRFADAMPNIHVFSMVIPKPSAYYIKGSPIDGDTAGDTLKDLQAIEERLSSKVQSINVYDTLAGHTEEPIYFRTDHHWTALGAYYGTQKFASDAGLPFADLSTFTLETREKFLGSMYTYTKQSPKVAKLAEDFPIYKPSTTYQALCYDVSFQNPKEHDIFYYVSDDHRSLFYLTFINGDGNSWKIHSDACGNGRKVLLIKDSYGNAMVPFLLSSYEEIYVADARTFTRNLKEFVTEQGITDVLFAECAFSARLDSYIKCLEELTK